MNIAKTLSLMTLVCAASAVWAQQQATPPVPAAGPKPSVEAQVPPKSTALSEAGEPRADTSKSATTDPAPSAGTVPSPGPAPASPKAAGRAVPGAGPGRKPASKIDRLELGLATVTGEREQPKVMYIVPWKRSDIGDLAGKPMNSLIDEILAPVDRDVFKREVVYYRAVQAEASQNGAPPKPAQQGEK